MIIYIDDYSYINKIVLTKSYLLYKEYTINTLLPLIDVL